MRARILGCCVLGAVLAWGELEHWRAAHRELGSGAATEDTVETVVVLGFRNRGARANAVNRWRVRAALRSRRTADARLVCCGGAVAGGVPEAELLAQYARRKLGYSGALVLESESRSTWENIRNAIPLLEDAGPIKIVSHSPHAAKGRRYLRAQRPDLAERLTRGADYRFGEWILVKPLLAVIGRAGSRQPSGTGESGLASSK